MKREEEGNSIKGGQKSREKGGKPSSRLWCTHYSLFAKLCVELGVPRGRPSPFSEELPRIRGGQTQEASLTLG